MEALKKRFLEVLRKAKDMLHKKIHGGGNPGTRAWPTRNKRNDANPGLRLDWGEKYSRNGVDQQNLNFQLDK
jgi:hypothetical protein